MGWGTGGSRSAPTGHASAREWWAARADIERGRRRAGLKPAPTPGVCRGLGEGGSRSAPTGHVLRVGESFGRDWGAGHLWIPACAGMTGVRVRGLCGGFEGWRRAIVLDPPQGTRGRLSASLGMTIGARGLTERGWSGRVSNPPLRGVVLRFGECTYAGAHLCGSGCRGGGSWVGGLGYTPGSQSIQELDDGDETTASTGAPLLYARLHP